MRWAGRVARIGNKKIAYSVLVGRPEGKRPFVRPRCRWGDDIEIDLQEVGCRAWTGVFRFRIGTVG